MNDVGGGFASTTCPTCLTCEAGCSSIPFAHGDVLNPTINATYDTIDKFLGDMVQVRV